MKNDIDEKTADINDAAGTWEEFPAETDPGSEGILQKGSPAPGDSFLQEDPFMDFPVTVSGNIPGFPEADVPCIVYADPEASGDLLEEFRFLESSIQEQTDGITARLDSIQAGVFTLCLLLGLIAGEILMLGLWIGGRK